MENSLALRPEWGQGRALDSRLVENVVERREYKESEAERLRNEIDTHLRAAVEPPSDLCVMPEQLCLVLAQMRDAYIARWKAGKGVVLFDNFKYLCPGNARGIYVCVANREVAKTLKHVERKLGVEIAFKRLPLEQVHYTRTNHKNHDDCMVEHWTNEDLKHWYGQKTSEIETE